MKNICLIALILGAVLVLNARAQQPGTTQYNNVYLPAQGLGDTVRGGRMKLGAVALGKGGDIGWYLNGDSEGAARMQALEDCVATGAVDCDVVQVFHNACAAFAQGKSGMYFVTSSDPRMRAFSEIKRDAIMGCEKDDDECVILKEGCAFPRD